MVALLRTDGAVVPVTAGLVCLARRGGLIALFWAVPVWVRLPGGVLVWVRLPGVVLVWVTLPGVVLV